MIKYILPETLDGDISHLEGLIARYKRGEISAQELKAYRVPCGIYEQRERDTYMVRIRCAAGVITPSQLENIAQLSSRYGARQIHLTTRQEIQIHYVTLDTIIPVLKELRKMNLASRGGGGNTVRNIIAPEDAGINPGEVFDVSPHAIALTSRLLAEDDSWTLPRKFKVAFSGSSDDEGYATITDLGFIARIKEGKKGFKVYAAGGLGAKSQIGKPLFDFIPAEHVYMVARALKMLFWKQGNRKNKHAARLRFLWQALGEEEFKKQFMSEYQAIQGRSVPAFVVQEIENKAARPKGAPHAIEGEAPAFARWRARFVRPQKQKGLFSIIVPVELGFIDNERAMQLAKFTAPFGDNVLRMSKDQNFLIRNIEEQYLPDIYNHLKRTMDNFNRPFIFDKIISCAGASTCQLGICLSRGAAWAIMRALKQSALDLDAVAGITMNISGCPNSCGQHPAADLGFFGKASRKEGRLYPAYNVVAGAVIRDGETRLSETVGEVSAHDLPQLVKEFLSVYLSKSSAYKNFEEYIQREGKEDLQKLCAAHADIPRFEEDKNYYFDWEAHEAFSLATRGSGECSAGLFDLIEVDIKNIEKTRQKIVELAGLREDAHRQEKQHVLWELVFYACRMLLITRGIEPAAEKETYDGFCKHFIDTALVNASLREIVKAAETKNYTLLLAREHDAVALAERVMFLYEHMDNAFQFKVGATAPPVAERPAKTSATPQKHFKDLRGVACPMNFVKTKTELARLQSKEILEIWLDDGEPIENVPGSLREEGHKIIEQKKTGDYWSVVIEKK